MNYLTIVFSSILHIILVLLFEGVFLFAILIPLIAKISKRIARKLNAILYTKKDNYFPGTLPRPTYPRRPQYMKYDPNTDNYIVNPNYNTELTHYYKDWKVYDDFYYNLKTIFTPAEKTILRYGVVDETMFLKTQKKMPYIMFGIILLILITAFIIIIFISKKYKIPIDYKFTIINSIIVFLLICGFAASLLWYSVFSQSYKLDINKRMFQSVLDNYTNL
jgi:hypothetical protein